MLLRDTILNFFYILHMNNFLRQFGSFKKNQNGLNEYVDYLGAKYTQDPQTGMWKSNGRSLNEQMLFEEALKSQGGYGGEEGSGGRSQASRVSPVYTLGFAASADQTTALANPFADASTNTGSQLDSANRYATINHTAPVSIKFKLTAKTLPAGVLTAATLKLRVGAVDQITFNIFNAAVNAESTAYKVAVNEGKIFVLRYNATWVPLAIDAVTFTVDIINAELGTVIDSLTITDLS
jgi:hypothetical protein